MNKRKIKKRHRQKRMKRNSRKYRLIVEENIGRRLRPEETVHHIDLCSDNNSIENLFVFSSVEKHQKSHELLNELIKRLIKERKISFNRTTGLYEESCPCLPRG